MAGLLVAIRLAPSTSGHCCHTEGLAVTFLLWNIKYRCWKQASESNTRHTHRDTHKIQSKQHNSDCKPMHYFHVVCFLWKHLTDDTDIFGADCVFRAAHHASWEHSESPQTANSWITHDFILREKDRPSGAHAFLVCTRKACHCNTWHRASGYNLLKLSQPQFSAS